ncbi:hypothetical protein EVAR_97726_1 [Eumeta japonica]|uniref:Uncharacterized protein n=1 Tax=Eumeta variegata TaxID=151549 RepID=A0A4C1XXS9_EUMVA|nr:hypothetical protein EVAR_97726_1 [Eumeta japonica]
MYNCRDHRVRVNSVAPAQSRAERVGARLFAFRLWQILPAVTVPAVPRTRRYVTPVARAGQWQRVKIIENLLFSSSTRAGGRDHKNVHSMPDTRALLQICNYFSGIREHHTLTSGASTSVSDSFRTLTAYVPVLRLQNNGVSLYAPTQSPPSSSSGSVHVIRTPLACGATRFMQVSAATATEHAL